MKKTKTKIISTDKSLSLYEIGVSLFVTLAILLQFYFLLLVHMYDSRRLVGTVGYTEHRVQSVRKCALTP